MTNLLVSIHVVAALLVLGPITVAGSLFPRAARNAAEQDDRTAAVARLLHRITTGYAVAAVTVPVFGVGAATEEHVFGQAWLQASLGLVTLDAIILGVAVVPGQRRALASLDRPGDTSDALARHLRRLQMLTGAFATIWVAVAVLMVTKPGAPR